MRCFIGHKWGGCVCKRCVKQRDDEHAFAPIEGKCVERCGACGKERSMPHQWNRCRCRRCPAERDEDHQWRDSSCEICGKTDFSPTIEPFLRRKGLRYSEKDEEEKTLALATILGHGVDGERFLVDFLVRDVTISDNRFLLKQYGDFAHAEWLKKRTIIRALANAKNPYVVEKLAEYLMCVGAENQFAVILQPAVAETLGRLNAYDALERLTKSGQRVPAVQLCRDILRLRDAGAINNPLNRRDNLGYAPLHDAVDKKDRAVIADLLDRGADIDVIRSDGDSLGQTALYMAAVGKDSEMVRLLLSRGANANIQDMSYSSPLQRASAMGLGEIVTLLVDGGADVNIKTLSGKTPLIWAEQNGHRQIADYLRAHGAI